MRVTITGERWAAQIEATPATAADRLDGGYGGGSFTRLHRSEDGR